MPPTRLRPHATISQPAVQPASLSASGRAPLLPARLVSFARHRLMELCGGALALVAVLLLGALISYNAADPSFSVTRVDDSGPIGNWLGPPGAYAADFLWQTIGLAGGLMVLCLGFWGGRLLTHRSLGLIPVRIICLFISLPLLSAGLSLLGSGAESSAVTRGLGGATGPILLEIVSPGVDFRNKLALGLGLFGLSIWILALGMSRAEWAASLLALARGTARLSTGLFKIALGSVGLLSHMAKGQAEGPRIHTPTAPRRNLLDLLPRPQFAAAAPASIRAPAQPYAQPPAYSPQPHSQLSTGQHAPMQPAYGQPAMAEPHFDLGPVTPTARNPVPPPPPIAGQITIHAQQPPPAPAGYIVPPPMPASAGLHVPPAPPVHAQLPLTPPPAPPAPPPRPLAAYDLNAAMQGQISQPPRLMQPVAAPVPAPPAPLPVKKVTAASKLLTLVKPRGTAAADAARQAAELQPGLALGDHGYQLPPLSMLQAAPANSAALHSEETLRRNAVLLESVLQEFGVKGEIMDVRPGPVVTLYELNPAPGIRTSRVIGLADEIKRAMSALSVRASVVPGRSVIGIELPNASRDTVWLRELMASEVFNQNPAKLALILGKDISGEPVIADLARMPHLLVAGRTGSGKSVGVNTMILSLLYRLRPDQCRFIMIDPKMLELSVYEGIPHLLCPVVTDPKKAVMALNWVVREMENRYQSMSKLNVRNIDGYNARLRDARDKGEVLTKRVQTGFDGDTGKPVYEDLPIDLNELPYIVVIVDEFADLMMVAGKDIEGAIQRLAQKARAAGIHLIMATQRPSVDVVTGTIKANLPVRVSFAVSSKIDSRTIIGDNGAEQLLGNGDMLFLVPGVGCTRVHGPFVKDEEVEKVVAWIKSQGEPDYIDAITEDEERGGYAGDDDEGGAGPMGVPDNLFDQAVALVTRERKASISFVQRHLGIGYNKAAKLIERMEKEGIVGTANHVGRREVLAGDQSRGGRGVG